MAIYDRWGTKLDLIGAVEIEDGHWALHTRIASKPDGELQLAESNYLRADRGWGEIEMTCETLAVTTPRDVARMIKEDFDAMIERVNRRNRGEDV